MNAPPKRRRPAGTGRQVERESKRATSLSHRPPAQQAARLRLAARCLNFSAVFVNDAPLTAELFDARGRLAERWTW